MTAEESKILELTQKLLDSIANGDWATYVTLCDPGLTAIEPEAPGQIVRGLDFHKFYFDLGGIRGPHRTTICSPVIRICGDSAIIAYARLVQKMGDAGFPVTLASMETRIWQKRGNDWIHVHFHRS